MSIARTSIAAKIAATAFLAALPACRKQTPVDEVSVAETGVRIVTQDRSDLQHQWPQWRGPDGSGVAEPQPVPTRWDRTEGIRWRADVPGRGHASPIVVGGQVVLATAVEDRQQQLVLAYDQQTGQPLWRTVIHEGNFPAPREVHSKASHANGTVASDGTRLVTAFFNGGRIIVTALDLKGETLWQTDVGGFASRFGYAPSPAIYQSFAIVAADNLGGGYLVALDLQSGDVAWRRSRGDDSSYSSPRVATVGGIDQLLISGGNRLASYDPATGQQRWETECIAEATCGTVVTTEQHVIASGGYPDRETVCLDADGNRVWSNRTKVYEPSLVCDGEFVYGVSDDGIATCWRVSDGQRQWRERLGGGFSSSPVICDGRIYVFDLSGRGHVFAANGDAFDSMATNPTGDDVYASPAIAGDALFVRVGIGQDAERREQLICIADSESQDDRD